MKNLFTFGCSHTNHGYPTWANILGEQFENHYNFGKGGSGVFYSFYQIVNIIQNKEKWNITEDDYFIWLVTEENRQDFIMHSEPWPRRGHTYGGFDWWTDNWYNNSQNWWTENYEKNMSSMDGLIKAQTHIYTIKELLKNNNIKHKIILALDGSGYPASVNYDEYRNNVNKIIGEHTSLQAIFGLFAEKYEDRNIESALDELHYSFKDFEYGEGPEQLHRDGHFQIPVHIKFLQQNFMWFKEKNIEKYLEMHEKYKTRAYTKKELWNQSQFLYRPGVGLKTNGEVPLKTLKSAKNAFGDFEKELEHSKYNW